MQPNSDSFGRNARPTSQRKRHMSVLVNNTRRSCCRLQSDVLPLIKISTFGSMIREIRTNIHLGQLVGTFFKVQTRHDDQVNSTPHVDEICICLILNLHLFLNCSNIDFFVFRIGPFTGADQISNDSRTTTILYPSSPSESLPRISFFNASYFFSFSS